MLDGRVGQMTELLFDHPQLLLLIPPLEAGVLILILRLRRNVDLLKRSLKFVRVTRWRFLFWATLAGKFLLVIVAIMLIASPYLLTVEKRSITVEEAMSRRCTVIVLLDVSKSMSYDDRFSMEMEVLREIVRNLRNSSLIIVKFAGMSEVVYAGNGENLGLELSPNETYTSIGDALMFARGLARGPSVVILLSDGGNNGGSDPIKAAEALKKSKIPVIAVQIGEGASTNASLMRSIAEITGGKFFLGVPDLKSIGEVIVSSGKYAALKASGRAEVKVLRRDYDTPRDLLMILLVALVILELAGG